MSLIPSSEPLPQEIIYTASPEIQSGIAPIDNAVNPVLSEVLAPADGASANPTQIWSFILSHVWLIGMAAMLLYALGSFLLLKRRMATATLLRENIKQSELADSPFVLGLFRPTIYLPYAMSEADMAHVIAHEQAHIRRRDHWWKPLGFLLLSVYWFNPVLWLAYVLLCRDIEAACDEKVIADMEKDDRRAYSTALLNCSVHRRRIAACPLAFGEVGVKDRVKSVMNYKKPAFWIIAVAVAASIVVAVCFLTNPYDSQAVKDELENNTCETISIQVINMPNYAESGIIEVTDAATIERLVTKLQDATYKKPLRKIGEAPDNLAADIALINSGKSFMRILLLSSVSTGNEFEIYVFADSDTQLVVNEPLTISGSIVSLIESNGSADALDTQEKEKQIAISDVYFTYGEKQYDLSERNGSINEITDCFQIGEYLVLEGHTGPKHNVYCVFNTHTETFETDIAGANLTWHGEDIHTAVYAFWNEVFTYDGRLLASLDLTESEYIYALEYSDDGTQIEAEILSNTGDGRTETIPVKPAEQENELAMIQALRDATMDNSTLTRIEGNVEAGVNRSGATMDVLKSAAESLQVLQDPMAFDAHTGGTYLWLGDPGDRHISFFAGKEPYPVKIRYVGDDINESAVTENPQLYLFLLAAAEMENVELHDLDGDGLLEGIVWPFPMERRNIIIYDVFDGALQRIDVNDAMDSAASDFTGLIANIHPDYSRMIQIADDAGQVDVYEYHDGAFSYVCPLSDVIGYAPPHADSLLEKYVDIAALPLLDFDVKDRYVFDDRVLLMEDTVDNELERVVFEHYYCISSAQFDQLMALVGENTSLQITSKNEEKNFNEGIYMSERVLHSLETLPATAIQGVSQYVKDDIAEKLAKHDLTAYAMVSVDISWKYNELYASMGPQLEEGRYMRYWLLGKTASDPAYRLYELYWDSL